MMSVVPAASVGAILVVEDEALLRMMAIDMFEDAGFTVFAAENGEDAAQALALHSAIDGVFTDVEMPGAINGLMLARMAHEMHPHAAILIVSGRANPSTRDMPPGARFVGKPYDNQTVVKMLIGLLPSA
jgi:CheY-like chemotaxis protein